MPPSTPSTSTHYALVIDAGSSGSRLQIYSWRDPDLERAEILEEVGQARRYRGGKGKWWWEAVDGYRPGGGKGRDNGKGKGKGRDSGDELEIRALRRLVRVGKGVEGDNWVKRVEPGISTVSPGDIPDYLSPLLTHALQQIPPSQHSSTPIYVLATAGMRLLPPETRDAILSATCRSLRTDYPFSVGESSSAGPCGENVRVITGEEEGIWGWVAVNYLMDGFGHAPDPMTVSTTTALSSSTSGLLPLAPLAEAPSNSLKDSVTPVDINHHSPTFGFLDMGGASTQLAFSPTPAELARSEFPLSELETVSLRLLSGEEVTWPVFVASWLGFGTNRVRERYIEQLMTDWNQEVSSGRVSSSTPIPDPCLPSSLYLPVSDDGSSHQQQHPGFQGTGSFTTCLTALKPLLESSKPCPTNHCLFASLPTPYIDFERDDQRGFIGISEYWYTAQQVLGLGGVWDWGEWENGMNQFCSRDWSEIENEVEIDKGWRGAEVELSRLQMQCFKGAWISNVLHEGIGIPRLVDVGGNDTLTGGELGETNAEANRRAKEKGLKSKSHFQSMDEVGETAISWTLGKMVIEASRAIPLRHHSHHDKWGGWMMNGPEGLSGFRVEGFEKQMTDLGIHFVWGYVLVGLVIISCLFTTFKKRSTKWQSSPRRARKPSISGDTPRTSVSPSSLSFTWPWSKEDDKSLSVEDGYDTLSNGATPPKYNSRMTGRLRLWSLRFGSLLKRLPFGHHYPESRSRNTMRHASMPLSNTSYSNPYANGFVGSLSQPGSPKREPFFFTPAAMAMSTSNSMNGGLSSSSLSLSNNSLGVPMTRPGSVSPESRSSRLSPSGLGSASSVDIPSSASMNNPNSINFSPPRLKTSRPGRPRQNSNNPHSSLLTVSISGDPSISSISASTSRSSLNIGPTSPASAGGWNDPPLSAFFTADGTMIGGGGGAYLNNGGIGGNGGGGGGGNGGGIDRNNGTLTPTAGLYPDMPVLSRNSSRVNLNDTALAGLAQRSNSRATTPHNLNDETP